VGGDSKSGRAGSNCATSPRPAGNSRGRSCSVPALFPALSPALSPAPTQRCLKRPHAAAAVARRAMGLGLVDCHCHLSAPDFDSVCEGEAELGEVGRPLSFPPDYLFLE
jgi:hypothetical protein